MNLRWLAFLFLFAGPAFAQNVNCATRPVGDTSNACASTAFVQSAIGPGGSLQINSTLQFDGSGKLGLAAQSANSVLGNATGSSAVPTALTMPSCSGASNALIWTASGGFGCNTISGGGSGTVTSVGQTFTGGLISVAGSPVTTSGTLALTVAGTSGGIPYFSSATGWASSAALTANKPVIGGGAGTAPTVGTASGSTTEFATASGVLTSGDCVSIDASGNFVDAGGACTTGGGGGTVSSGTINQLARYAATGTTVSGLATANNGVLITSGSGVPSISSTIPTATQSNITTVGTIGTGTWQGTLVSPTFGGSGVSNPTAHGVLLAEGSSAFASLAIGTSGRLLVDQGAAADPAFEAMSGDCTFASSGAITCTKTNGTAFGTAAAVNTGTGSGAVGLNNGNNTYSGNPTFSGKVTYSGVLNVKVRSVTSTPDSISATADYFICVNDAAAVVENLPSSPATGLTYLIKDCGGNAATDNITITPAAGNIDGVSTFVMDVAHQSVGVTYDGTQWEIN